MADNIFYSSGKQNNAVLLKYEWTESKNYRELFTSVDGGNNWISINNLFIPVGTILPWLGKNTPPAGFLLCDGSSVYINDYTELYNQLKNINELITYIKVPNYPDKFKIPYLIGRYLVGSGNTELGKFYSPSLPKITGSFYGAGSIRMNNAVVSGAFGVENTNLTLACHEASAVNAASITFDASKSSRIYNNTTNSVIPSSFGVKFMIKY